MILGQDANPVSLGNPDPGQPGGQRVHPGQQSGEGQGILLMHQGGAPRVDQSVAEQHIVEGKSGCVHHLVLPVRRQWIEGQWIECR